MVDRELERMERNRVWRLKAGLLLGGMGLALVGARMVVGDRLVLGVSDSTLGMVAGFMVGLGLLTVWMNRAGDAARLLAESGGARERAQLARSRMLSVIPLAMIAFGVASVEKTAELLAGTGGNSDRLMVGSVLLYAWLGPVIVMGWDGKSLRNRRLLEDELTRHHRAKAILLAFFVLLTGLTALVVTGLWRPDLAISLLPLTMCVAGAAAALRFAWLDRRAGQDG